MTDPKRTIAEYQRDHIPRGRPGGEPEAIRIWLLGGFRVRVRHRSIGEDQWRLKKAATLIKVLALAEGHRLHLEQAMELLWPTLDPEAAANNLHQALHAARRILESSAPVSSTASRYLRLRDEWLALCPEGPLWVDVGAFEEAAATARRALEPAAFRAAIELYSGELLPEDRHEPWAEERRAELSGLYLSLLIELAGLYEERQEFEGAIEALERVVAEEPANEGAHVGLMRLYALSGRRKEALSQYDRLRETLFRELGVELEEEASRLRQEIWAGTFPPSDPTPAVGSVPGVGAPSPALAGARHNLPLARTSFVGREREVLEVKRLLAMTRLLTLTGAGGCGKTRLALKVAGDLAGAYPEGAWLVELAPLSEPELVPQAVAEALGVREQPNRSLVQTLKDVLRAKKMLLVLDNCEHLVDAVVGLIDTLLESCPGLRVLATSRETLDAAGEVSWVVPPLTVPDARQGGYGLGELEGYESVRLLVERARQRDPSFAMTSRNGQAVTDVCRRLEGIPLAIELAAGRIGVLSAAQIARRLEGSLKLLGGDSRTAEPRHRTLRATLDWSFELLDEAERALFGRLSVFAGGWTPEAAEEVCSGEGIERKDVPALHSELVEKSLVVVEEAGAEEGASRFRMLEPVRQYARQRLEERGEAKRVREGHAEYYLRLAEGEDAQGAERQLNEARPVAWLERMEAEHANLRAALDWSLDEDAEPDDGRAAELGLRLAVELMWLWHAHQIEGRRYFERAASRTKGDPSTTRLRALALNGAAAFANFQGDHEAAKVLMEESMALYREMGDKENVAAGLTNLGLVAVLGQREDIPLPAVMEELRQLKPEIKNRNTLAYLLVLEGIIVWSRGDLERSVALHQESLELFREIRDTQGVIVCLTHLGLLAMVRGDYEGAASVLREGLRKGWEADYKVAIQNALNGLACVAAGRERPVRAARLWGAVEGMQDAYRVRIAPAGLSVTDYEGRLGAARSQLADEAAWSAAWEEGKAMPLEQAIDYAFSEAEEERPTIVAVPEQPPADEAAGRLTRREREVALLIGRGLTNRQIALELSVSEHTVANHVAKILKKLGLRSRAHIVARMAQQ